jgi:hypothetical protein
MRLVAEANQNASCRIRIMQMLTDVELHGITK